MNINLCQTKSLILKVSYSITMLQKSTKSIHIEQSQKKDSSDPLGQSNPFKINIKQIENENPFQMNLGVTNKSGGLLFARQNQSNEEDNFSKIMIENELKPRFTQQLEFTKLNKNESKMQSHTQQNIKKYKDTLRLFYNKKYWQKVKNMEDSMKRIKKQGSGSMSQEIRVCFKANRLPFNRENKIKVNSYQKLEQHYLIGYSKAIEQITIYELKHPNIRQLKPLIVKLMPEQKFSSSIQYDPNSGRIFLFSNQNQQIVVLSSKAKQVICKIKVKYERNNPFLYLNKYKNNTYLMVIGGFRILNNQIVEGSKYIEIFSIERWEISLKQVILRLGIGRISPIVFSCDQDNEQSLFIIGGSSLASLNRNRQVFFNIDQDINYSTNKTAVKIDCSFIEQCFLNENQGHTLLTNNINVQFYSPLQLYGGVVLFRKLPKSQKFELFLPNKRQIYTIKTLKNDVHIITSQLISEDFLNNKKQGVMSRSIGYHRGQNNISQLYRVDESGKLKLVDVTINEKKSKIKQEQDECKLI